jgi:hypothetical protein
MHGVAVPFDHVGLMGRTLAVAVREVEYLRNVFVIEQCFAAALLLARDAVEIQNPGRRSIFVLEPDLTCRVDDAKQVVPQRSRKRRRTVFVAGRQTLRVPVGRGRRCRDQIA